jgi:amino acid adenylation domain-containing protein
LLYIILTTHLKQRYDALIIVDSDGEKLRFTLKHNSAALPNQQAASIAGSIMQAIQCFWQDLNQKVRDVDLVDRRSRGYIAQWNNRAMAIDYHLSIAGSIDKISHLKPDAQAIASWDGELTYGQLENLSSRLALHLKGLGIGESVMVPLCFGKSSWAIVATLAVLKSGAAFVPLDASHPLTRLKEIITHVNAAFVLVSDQHAALFAGTADNVIVISESTVGHLQDVGILAHHAQPHHVAYVLFTSGSTGSPKGCVVEHRALAAVICHGEALGISTASRVLQFASYSFGVSLIEIFCTLTAGGVLCIPSDHERTNDPPGAIRRMKANWTLLTPSLVNCIDAECVPSLKTLVVAGEPLTKNVLEHWASKVRLISAYGLTEWAGICTVQTQILSIKNTHNIGSSPSANLWLVNPRNREVLAPIGAVAELLIEGPCLAQGYLGDTERTAAAFIENPSWLQPFTSNRTSRRLYRTGDLVRYSPDGTINYVGRKGLQAKIRGQRVELGEVEYHVCRHFLNTTKAIADVVVPAGEAQSPVLVAFILSRGHRSKEPERALAGPLSDSIFCEPDEAFRLNAATANFMIRDLLPDYMIPQAYVPLRYVPLTVTGKVSRLMLKDAVRAISYEALVSYTHIKQKVVSPVSNIEKILHRLVAHTLKLPPDAFGVNDSFFQLGGDSIKAMKLVTQGRAEGVFLTVQDIFLEKTVARISRCAEADDDRATLAQTDAEFRLSYIQQQMIHTEPKSSDGSTQKLCLRVKSSVDPSFLENAIYQVVRRHPMLRTRFSQNPNGEWTQAIEQEPRGTYNYKHRAASNETEALEIMATNQQILDIGNGPNFAALYINVAGGSQFLMLLAHELTVDQISWKIILADTETVLNGGTLTDQPPPKPFQEWCCSEQDKDLEHCVFAHNATLQDVSKQRLHSHAGDGLANSSHHVVRRFSVSPDATHSILSDAARVLRVEPIEIFQAAVLHSFTQTVESQDLPVMVIQEEGRELSHSGDFSNTIGPFVTLLPVEVVTSRQPDLLHILRQTKESYRQARKRRACPLAPRQGQLVEKSSLCVPRRQILLDFAMPSQQLGEWDSTLLQQTSFQARDYSNYIFAAHSGAWLGVSVSIINNCLEFSFRTLSDESLDVDLQHWSQECEQSIYNAVEILWQRNPIFTPSDFPLLDLKAAEIEHFLDARLSATGIDQADIEVAYPCSPIQQGMLLSQALQPQTYQMFFIWEVTNTGDRQRIDVDRLQSAWLQLTRYHSILRTIFVEGISQYPFIQVLLNPGAARTKVLRCANGDARATLLENKWSGQQGAPPLLPQFTVCETDSGRVLCALDISHLVTDATSMGILERDLALVYDALPISDGAQYGDYVKFLGSLPKDPALEYWRGYLAGCDPCFFPRLHEASAASSDPAELQSVQVPFKDTSQIYAFCHTTGLTASNILQVAWGLVLRAFTGQDTVCFGYLTSGRDAPIPGIENGVGPYINMLICRLDFNESAAAVTQLLRKAQTDFATALAHQHFSLSDLFHAMDLGGTTLFNTCMTFPPEDVYGEMDEKRSINMMEVENYMADEVGKSTTPIGTGMSLTLE